MLTYQDRIAALRKTKIAHTLAKKEQNGTMDLDDFGTVPLPPDYFVEPYYNSDNGSFYGLFGMCENFCRVMAAHPPYVDPMEMLCGRWRDMLVNYRGDVHYLPTWIKKNEKLRDLITAGASAQWSKRWDEKRFPYDHLKPLQKKYNIQTGIDGDAHFACDYRIGLALGFGGLLEKVRHYRTLRPEKKEFYDAEERCLLAIIDFVDRHIARIEEILPGEERPEVRETLSAMLKACRWVRLGAPRTFHEACQWVGFFNCAARVYTRDGAGFQLDTLLRPYFERDMQSGILDREKAKFLVGNLLLIDPHYYQISGVDFEDKDLTCPLSYVILEAAEEWNLSCNLTVRVHENCDKAFLRQAVACLLRTKNGFPRFCGDESLCRGYMKNGVDKKTARERIAVGCNWMCVPGREFPMNDTVKINVAKVLEEALLSMKQEGAPSLARLYALWEEHLAAAIAVTAEGINLHLDHVHEVTPELIMNLQFHGAIEQGLDASQCAELYTVGVDGAGLAVVADSFGAIAERIEGEGVLTWEELYEALESNFANERVRQILSSTPKYCAGGTQADEYALRMTESFTRLLRAQRMPEGRMLLPGWFSWARAIEYGATVGATPNGRRAGEPLSHGANPNPGFRKDGAATAQANGIARVQCGYGNAAPLQIEFDPKLSPEEGVDVILAFLEGHFAMGGTLVNINILDKDTVLSAAKEPEKYPELVVRVTGFTAYFVSLSPKFRSLVVSRFLENM